jgi:hypothetical protein
MRSCAAAAEWLITSGGGAPFVVAEHLERAGRTERAIPHYLESARQALRANECATARARCERGLAAGAAGALRSELLAVLGEALAWQGDVESSARTFEASLDEILSERSREDALHGCATIAWAALMGTMAGGERYAAIPARAAAELLAIEAETYPVAYFRACGWTNAVLYFRGDRERGDAVSARIETVTPRDVLAAGWKEFGRMVHVRFTEGDSYRARAHGLVAVRSCSLEADPLGHALMLTMTSLSEMSLGAFEEARGRAKLATEILDRFEAPIQTPLARAIWAVAEAEVGEQARARDLVARTIQESLARGDVLYAHYARVLAARAARLYGDVEAAIAECRTVLGHVQLVAMRLAGEVQLAAALVSAGEHAEALSLCMSAFQTSRAIRIRGEHELDFVATLVAALRGTGQEEAAAGAAERGRALVARRSAGMDDPEIRQKYVAHAVELGLG